jgi:C4-dicarboxylate transporter
LNVWLQALQQNLYLVVMFALVPLLKIPIQHGGYFDALQTVFSRYVNTNSRFYLLTSFVSAFVGVLVNMAVVPIMNEICKASHIYSNKKLVSSAISRGFTSCLIWSPTMAATVLIIQFTGVEWPRFFPYAILCAAIVGLVGYIMTLYEYRGSQNVVAEDVSAIEGEINLNKVIELGLFSILLISSIAVLSIMLSIPTITMVSFAALTFPIIWMAIIGRLPVFFREFKGDYFKNSLINLNNEIILFVGAGLFASSITYSHLGKYVPQMLTMLVGHNILLLTIVIFLVTLLLAAIGVHPIITIVVIAETVNATTYGVSPIYMSLVLACSWAMGISISPAAANIIAVAAFAGQSPFQVGLGWNRSYVLISSSVLIIFITILRYLGLI